MQKLLDNGAEPNHLIEHILLASVTDITDLVHRAVAKNALSPAEVHAFVIRPDLRNRQYGRVVAVAEALSDHWNANPRILGDMAVAEQGLGQAARASAHTVMACDLAPNDADLTAEALQILLKARDAVAASDLVAARPMQTVQNARVRLLAMKAFYRAGRIDEAAACAELLLSQSQIMLDDATVAAQVLLTRGRSAMAQKILERAGAATSLDVRALFELGRAIFMGDHLDPAAIEVLEQALQLDPANHRVLDLLARAQVAHGNLEKAAELLKRIPVELRSRAAATLMGNILAVTGAPEQAVDLLKAVLDADPSSQVIRRQLIAAVVRGGNEAEAKRLYAQGIDQRRINLPQHLAEGIGKIFAEPNVRILPQRRLDWVWDQLERRSLAPTSRSNWDAQANSIFRVDSLLLDWLECQPERGEEVIAFIDGIAEGRALLEPLYAQGQGVLFVGAHVGVLYAGAAALVASGTDAVWLASMPQVSGGAYSDRLVSTATNNEAAVSRKVLEALKANRGVFVAMDGVAARRRNAYPLLDRQIALTDFVPRLIFRRSIPSAFFVCLWKEGRLKLELRILPMPEPDDTAEVFHSRWMQAYLDVLEHLIFEHPENLRFSGGMWNGINV